MAETHCIFEARSISRRTADSVALLDKVSLSVSAGEKWAVTGPTGSGKTLLLRALALLDPIDEGALHWKGGAIAADQFPQYRSDVIYLHQRAVLVDGTVEDNLRQPFKLKSSNHKTFDRDATVDRLARLGQNASFLEKSAKELSGGEAQIVAILRAIQLNPSALLLDEPTSAMDATTVVAFESLMSDWIAESPTQRAYVWVSHDPRQVTRVSDHELQLN